MPFGVDALDLLGVVLARDSVLAAERHYRVPTADVATEESSPTTVAIVNYHAATSVTVLQSVRDQAAGPRPSSRISPYITLSRHLPARK